jgi:hypothetical protein
LDSSYATIFCKNCAIHYHLIIKQNRHKILLYSKKRLHENRKHEGLVGAKLLVYQKATPGSNVAES